MNAPPRGGRAGDAFRPPVGGGQLGRGPRERALASPGFIEARQFRELFLALRRGFTLGRCRACETFHLMAKLCLEEGGELLAPHERADASSWVEGGTLVDLEFGCEGACAVIPLYARIAR